MALNKTSNEYADQVANLEAPKAVVAAIAYSLALRLCGDDHAAAKALIATEWGALHQAGVIPQKPAKTARTVAGSTR